MSISVVVMLITALLDYANWDGWGIAPQVWAVVMLVAGVTIGLLIAFTRRDVPYLLVLVWAFVGIGLEQAGAPLVPAAAWSATAVLVVVILLLIVSNFRQDRHFIYAI